jgi:hypothetical protein
MAGLAPLFDAIVVCELPAASAPRAPAPAAASASAPPEGARGPSTAPARPQQAGGGRPTLPPPRFVLTLPHGDASRIDKNVLAFAFPDIDHLARTPWHYEHTAEEYVFALTRKNAPKLFGFCRRYRVGPPQVGYRLDISPFTGGGGGGEGGGAGDDGLAAFQCICILSER